MLADGILGQIGRDDRAIRASICCGRGGRRCGRKAGHNLGRGDDRKTLALGRDRDGGVDLARHDGEDVGACESLWMKMVEDSEEE